MAGYIGSKSSVTLVDGYTEAEADAEFVTKAGDSMTGNLSLGDNNKAIFGAGSDLQIYSDGATSYIKESGSSNLKVQADDFYVFNAAGNSVMVSALDTGKVGLGFAGVEKFKTTSTGIDVTGGVSIDDDNNFSFGDGTAYIQGSGANDRLKFITNNSEAMRIDSSGRVGIGSPPAYNLHIEKAGNQFIFLNNASTNDGFYFKAGTGASSIQTNGGSNVLNFFTSGNERMRIDSSGNLLVGTTSVSAGASSGKFVVGFSGNTANGIKVYDSYTSAATNNAVVFIRGSSEVGSITTTTSATAYNTSSDYRLKENVVDLTGASARVNQLDVKRFNFIADDTNTLVDGFLAHEVATVVPEAITGTKDAMRDEEYEVTPAVLDDGGNVTTEAVMGIRSVPKYQGIDQSKLVPLLTAALQEALTEIASLKTRVEALEA